MPLHSFRGTHYHFPRWQSIFAGTVGKDKSWLSCLLTEEINHPYTLEDTFPDCMLGTSLHKLCHVLLCILLLTGHRRTSTAYFCHVLWGRYTFFLHRQTQAWKGHEENDIVCPKISNFSKICSWLMIFLTCPNPISWCIKWDIITDNLPWSEWDCYQTSVPLPLTAVSLRTGQHISTQKTF